MPWEQETRGFWWPSSRSAWLWMLPHGKMFHSVPAVSINLLVVTSSLTFVCYVLKEVTHLKAKVRPSFIIPWTIQNTPPWCTGLPRAWRWSVSQPQPKSSGSRGQSQHFLHTGCLLQGSLQKMEPFSNIPLVLGPHSSYSGCSSAKE